MHYLIFFRFFFFHINLECNKNSKYELFLWWSFTVGFFFHLSKMWTGGICLKLAGTEYSESAPTHFCLSEVLTHFAFQASNPTSSFCVLIISMNNPAACVHTSVLLYDYISLASSCVFIWTTWQFLWIWKLDQHS